MNQAINNTTQKEWLTHHYGLTDDQVRDAAKTTGMSEEDVRKTQDGRLKSARGLIQHGAQIDRISDSGIFHLTAKQKATKEGEYFKEKRSWEAGDELTGLLGLDPEKNTALDRPAKSDFGKSDAEGMGVADQMKEAREKERGVFDTEAIAKQLEQNGSLRVTKVNGKDKRDLTAEENTKAPIFSPIDRGSGPTPASRDEARVKGVKKPRTEDVAEQKQNLLTAYNRLGKGEGALDNLENFVDRRAKGSGSNGLGGKEAAVRQALSEVRSDVERGRADQQFSDSEENRQIALMRSASNARREKGEHVDDLNVLMKQLRSEGVDLADLSDARARVFKNVERKYDERSSSWDKENIDSKLEKEDRRLYRKLKRPDGVGPQPAETEMAPLSSKFPEEELKKQLKNLLVYMPLGEGKGLESFIKAYNSGNAVDEADRQKAMVEINARLRYMTEFDRNTAKDIIAWLEQGGTRVEDSEVMKKSVPVQQAVVSPAEPSPNAVPEKQEGSEVGPNLSIILGNLGLLAQAKGALSNNKQKKVGESIRAVGRGLNASSLGKLKDTINSLRQGSLNPYYLKRIEEIEREISLAEKIVKREEPKTAPKAEVRGGVTGGTVDPEVKKPAEKKPENNEIPENPSETLREDLKSLRGEIESLRTFIENY